MDDRLMRAVATRRKRAERQERELSEQLRQLVVEALSEGMRPSEVVAITGWSPAQVRIVARAAGLAPAPRGPAPKRR